MSNKEAAEKKFNAIYDIAKTFTQAADLSREWMETPFIILKNGASFMMSTDGQMAFFSKIDGEETLNIAKGKEDIGSAPDHLYRAGFFPVKANQNIEIATGKLMYMLYQFPLLEEYPETSCIDSCIECHGYGDAECPVCDGAGIVLAEEKVITESYDTENYFRIGPYLFNPNLIQKVQDVAIKLDQQYIHLVYINYGIIKNMFKYVTFQIGYDTYITVMALVNDPDGVNKKNILAEISTVDKNDK